MSDLLSHIGMSYKDISLTTITYVSKIKIM